MTERIFVRGCRLGIVATSEPSSKPSANLEDSCCLSSVLREASSGSTGGLEVPCPGDRVGVGSRLWRQGVTWHTFSGLGGWRQAPGTYLSSKTPYTRQSWGFLDWWQTSSGRSLPGVTGYRASHGPTVPHISLDNTFSFYSTIINKNYKLV